MLESIIVVLPILWLIGIVSSYCVGSFGHILLAVTLVAVVLPLMRGRRAR